MTRALKPAIVAAYVGTFALVLGACGAGEKPATPNDGGAGASASGSASGGQLSASGSGKSGASQPASSGAPGAGENAGGTAGKSGGAGTAGASATGGSSAGASVGGAGGTAPNDIPNDATVVLFMIDGLQTAAIQTGISAGATNIKYLIDNGVTAQTVYTTSPAPKADLPDGSLPWGNATSGNVAAHTGCHLFESNQMDDIFLAAKAGGIKSLFAGGDPNYGVFDSASFFYSGKLEDAAVVQHAIDHVQKDGVRLIRLHLQRIRDFWTGPANQTTASSSYIQHLVAVDGLLGKLRQALEQQGVWNRTYVVLSSDHGMGQTGGSEHPPSTMSSWKNVMIFYGPNVKKGATIPYAETPDMAVLSNHLLKLPPLKGHTDPQLKLAHPGATGTLLSNIFVGQPENITHPRYIEKYLNTGTYMGSGTEYTDYRLGMLKILE